MGQNYFFGCISFNLKVIWPNLVRSEILDLGTLDLETAVKGSYDLFPKFNIRSFNSRIKRYMYIHRSCKNKCMLFLGNCKIIFRKAVKLKKQKKRFFDFTA